MFPMWIFSQSQKRKGKWNAHSYVHKLEMFFLFLVSTSATWWLTVKRLAHTDRLFLWLSFTTVWQLTLGTLTFNIPLPTVNSFYNQAALPWTQTQYQTLVCVEVQHTESLLRVGELRPSQAQKEEESIIPAAALYDAQIIIWLITHAALYITLFISISLPCTYLLYLCFFIFLYLHHKYVLEKKSHTGYILHVQPVCIS